VTQVGQIHIFGCCRHHRSGCWFLCRVGLLDGEATGSSVAFGSLQGRLIRQTVIHRNAAARRCPSISIGNCKWKLYLWMGSKWFDCSWLTVKDEVVLFDLAVDEQLSSLWRCCYAFPMRSCSWSNVVGDLLLPPMMMMMMYPLWCCVAAALGSRYHWLHSHCQQPPLHHLANLHNDSH